MEASPTPAQVSPLAPPSSRAERIALIGNPNSGKTTLFNELTGANQHVGNWPGVTVEKKSGSLRPLYGKSEIIDLPGIYSLSPFSLEEIVSRDYLVDEKPDVVINIVDATNLERNLYLTIQLIELNVPLVIALNMMDEVARDGYRIDTDKLSHDLGVPVVPISAAYREGIAELMDAVGHARLPRRHELPNPSLERMIALTESLLNDHLVREHHLGDAIAAGYPLHWTAIKVLESDDLVLRHLTLDDTSINRIEQLKRDFEDEHTLLCTAFADARYQHIQRTIAESYLRADRSDTAKQALSDRIDRVLTHRIWAIPIFLVVMFAVFHLTFTESLLGIPGLPGPGVALQTLVESGIEAFSSAFSTLFEPGSWSESLVINGVVGGVGAVLSFVPKILLLFFFLTLLEDCGYMARAAFIMDRLFKRFGLSGKSFLPMLMGFGCTVPAAMAARTMDNEQDRRLTLMLVPFMSCGARAPIYLVFAGAFFAAYADFIVFGLYLLGVLVAVISGIILRKLLFKGEFALFVIELPRYRLPRWRSVTLTLWDKFKGYLVRAGTIIFAMCVVIWFFSSFGFRPAVEGGGFGMVAIEGSLLAAFGGFIAPIFSPLGFGFWTAAVAVLTGFIAKESVVGTLGVLMGISEDSALGGGLSASVLAAAGFTPLGALSFMVFCLLYIPCMAAFATLKKEFGSWKWALGQAAYSVGVAYLIALLVYQVGGLFIGSPLFGG
ncbi:MAG: ferrous iron transport protein B [Coriobacteriales bacterium]|jgi:ferrous iron transport protein B|nr:ferrous iron transport protein B [Coriobacteriales bacterium]